MTSYEKELLALAVESAPYHRVIVWRDDSGWWRAECAIDAPTPGGTYLSSALTVLLRDVLGVEVPEWPTADRVTALFSARTGGNQTYFGLGDMRAAYRKDRLAVLALLEGGEA